MRAYCQDDQGQLGHFSPGPPLCKSRGLQALFMVISPNYPQEVDEKILQRFVILENARVYFSSAMVGLAHPSYSEGWSGLNKLKINFGLG